MSDGSCSKGVQLRLGGLTVGGTPCNFQLDSVVQQLAGCFPPTHLNKYQTTGGVVRFKALSSYEGTLDCSLFQVQ